MKTRVFGPLVLLALLPALVVLTPLAYASPPDPVWVEGFFDDDDHDDVVVVITSAGAALDQFPLDHEWTAPAPADPVFATRGAVGPKPYPLRQYPPPLLPPLSSLQSP
jgi:hypothetical protein